MEYKGYQLRPVPKQSASGKWSDEIVIEHAAQDDAEDFNFASGKLFPTAEEAEAAAIALGMQIINGEHPRFKMN